MKKTSTKAERRIFTISNVLDIGGTMDYSEDFRIIQTALNHCNEFVKKFDKILFYGGEKFTLCNLQTFPHVAIVLS